MADIRPQDLSAADLSLVDEVQRRSFLFFRDCAQGRGGMAPDRASSPPGQATIGGSGFAAMALVVAVTRGWMTRNAALERLAEMLATLERSERHHGVFPHWFDAPSGATFAFGPLDDGGDLVETAFLFQGLLTARQFFDRETGSEPALRARIDALWHAVEWDHHVPADRPVLLWHWSPRHGFAMNHEIRGWNECLITYLLAAASPTHGVPPAVYHEGFCSGPVFRNGRRYYGIELPLGPELGGPLFFAHYSFLGLDPRGLADRHADYWAQNVAHTRINHAYCAANPKGWAGYSADCWGLTASDDHQGYSAHAPDIDAKGNSDLGVISPTAALSSFPYTPDLALKALKQFHARYGERIFGRFGFTDAFSPAHDWYSDQYLAIDQGPIVIMIENWRSGLLWRLFMSAPEVQAGLGRLGFTTPAASA